MPASARPFNPLGTANRWSPVPAGFAAILIIAQRTFATALASVFDGNDTNRRRLHVFAPSQVPIQPRFEAQPGPPDGPKPFRSVLLVSASSGA
jgi:hypothetical protein